MMTAAWYERTGAAHAVFRVDRVPLPTPSRGQVRIRLAFAGINPKDVKNRAGAGGRQMASARVVPGDDGAGVIDAVGTGVAASRIGERVWVHSASVDGRHGTSAEYVVVPTVRAITLPPATSFEVGASLGVPALTAHHALYSGAYRLGESTVLVTGGAGAVGQFAIAFAAAAGAHVVTTVSDPIKASVALAAGAAATVDYRSLNAAEQILTVAKRRIDRVVDVAFGRNLQLVTGVIARNATLAAYGSDGEAEPRFPFYPLMRLGVTVRLISVFAMSDDQRSRATRATNDLLAQSRFRPRIAAIHPLHEIATAHQYIEDGSAVGKVLLRMG